MKKLFVALVSFFALFSIIGPGGNLAFAVNVDDYVIQDYQIDYYLGRDAQNRSTLKTTEQISAVFPAKDQNHGIERAIPTSYDGHTTNLRISSVTDATGAALNYTTYSSSGNTVLRIGDANKFVHGLQVYKITYVQSDVTRFFKDTNTDEFYWDTNGTEWRVPINTLTARLHLDGNLNESLVGKQQCYQGATGATKTCAITAAADGFVAATTSLVPYQNMTIAVGFKPNTFVPYKTTLAEKLLVVWIGLFILTLFIAVFIQIWFAIRYYKRSNRTAEQKTIVPEYLPPKDTSVSVSGSISKKTGKVFSAQLIDFAVRHYIKIYQTSEKSLFKPANYQLEIVKDVSNLKAEEQELLSDIFGDVSVGQRLDMQSLKNNTQASTKLLDNSKKLDTNINGDYGLRARDAGQSAWFKRGAIYLIILAVLTLSPWLLFAGFAGFIYAATLKPLTDKGLQLARYLKGLEMYIKVAETERLRMLQSPEGAAKIGAPLDTNDSRQLIKLYERVLPYAILFGQEKEWNNSLGRYYETLNQSPTWFSGNSAVFNAVVFTSAMSSFNTAAAYSNPTSSSTGGSSGGGFSGGGGGGGGGGGW